MTTTELAPDSHSVLSVTQASLPRWAEALTGVVALAVSGLLVLLAGWGVVSWIVIAGLLFVIALPSWSFAVESRRSAVDRLMTTLIWFAFGVALIPLAWMLWTVVRNGASTVTWSFLTSDMRNVVGAGGGIRHALIGTLLITFAAGVISVPIGILSAIYLVEYGKKNALARAVTFLVDVMTGIPSIVAGLFALSLFVLLFGPSIRFGFGGSVALSLLMIPIVVRSTEEMLRLVPDDLREASFALGVPKWRTIVKVVLPTALGGIITGVTLSVARVIGETAPLLVIAGTTSTTNYNLLDGRMATLPVYIYYQFTQPGIVPFNSPPGTQPPGIDRAWGAALVLIVLVLLINLLARVVGRIFAVPTK